MAIDLYYPFWSLLTGRYDVVVFDLRNHGWNSVSGLDAHNVPTLASDHDRILEAIDQWLGEKLQVGVFHSLSALVSLLSPSRGAHYSGLILYDPPLCKPGRSHQEFEVAAAGLAGFARRRTEKFRRREELARILPFLPPFRRFPAEVFDLMAATLLRPSELGEGFELRCPREYEAQIIDYASVYGVGVDFDEIKCPVKVVGSDPTLPFSYLPTLDLSDILSVDYDFLPEATHFLQLEKPQECAAALKEFLQGLGMM